MIVVVVVVVVVVTVVVFENHLILVREGSVSSRMKIKSSGFF